MAFSGQPSAVNGSKVSADKLRVTNNAATKGGGGIQRPWHLRVTQTSTPSKYVLINPGTAIFLSRYSATLNMESYIDTNYQAFQYEIAPTTAAGGRTDYIIAYIEDPDFPGQAAPADRIAGPYTKMRTLSSDPRLTLPPYPWVLLAKITIPPSTTNITNAMINTGPSIREVADPRNETFTLAWDGRKDGNTNIKANELTAMNGLNMYWLPYATADKYLKWEVPAWAGQLNIQYTLGSVYNNSYDCWGSVNLRLVDLSNMGNWVDLPAGIDFDTTSDDKGRWSRDTWAGAGRLTIPSWARGKTCSFRLVAAKRGGDQANAKIYLGAGATVGMVGTFMESAVDEVW